MDTELERIVELLESMNEHLQNINNNIERLTEGNWLESSIGDKLDNIVSKLDEIDSSIGNISTS